MSDITRPDDIAELSDRAREWFAHLDRVTAERDRYRTDLEHLKMTSHDALDIVQKEYQRLSEEHASEARIADAQISLLTRQHEKADQERQVAQSRVASLLSIIHAGVNLWEQVLTEARQAGYKAADGVLPAKPVPAAPEHGGGATDNGDPAPAFLQEGPAPAPEVEGTSAKLPGNEP